MTAQSRRRSAVLIAVAIIFAALAARLFDGRVREIDARVGPLVPVVRALEGLPEGARLDGRRSRARLRVEGVPQRFLPPDAVTSISQVAGRVMSTDLPAGGYLTEQVLVRASSAVETRPRTGSRLIELEVIAAPAIGIRGRVDVVATVGSESGGRTFVALEDVLLIDAQAARSGGEFGMSGGNEQSAASGMKQRATLLVTARQAVYLAAVSDSARTIRLLRREVGDKRRIGQAVFSAQQLAP